MLPLRIGSTTMRQHQPSRSSPRLWAWRRAGRSSLLRPPPIVTVKVAKTWTRAWSASWPCGTSCSLPGGPIRPATVPHRCSTPTAAAARPDPPPRATAMTLRAAAAGRAAGLRGPAGTGTGPVQDRGGSASETARETGRETARGTDRETERRTGRETGETGVTRGARPEETDPIEAHPPPPPVSPGRPAAPAAALARAGRGSRWSA